jgi:gamma-glutamyltranspeptidase/glutathione hydrolase
VKAVTVLCLIALLAACAAATATAREGSRFHPAVSTTLGVVATESPAAARVGRAVLEQGGNAIDAAAATVFALGVARPQSCGVGGGGFLVYRSHTGRVRALDFRETAPAAITPTTFSGPGPHRTFTGHTTVGVPGTVAGMDAALARYGTLRLAEAIAPAERIAREGFRVPTSLSGAMAQNAARLQLFPTAAEQFLVGGQAYAPGATLVQPQLAASLRRIMRGGPAAFYRGTIARRIVADMNAARSTGDPGLLTMADFEAYRAVWRPALGSTYRESIVFAMPPPTSGGVAILEMLNILEGFDIASAGKSSTLATHLVAEAQKIAFADRGAYVADPDFVRQPTATLLSKGYAGQRRGEIDPLRAGTYGPGAVDSGGTTTHVSVIDRRGSAVALTCTIEQEFGSAVVAPGTGILLNNELTDFSGPGTANAAAPGKRPRSSMSPTIVVQIGSPVFVGGGAGGARIIMGVLHGILEVVDFGADLPHAVDAERFDNLGGSRLNIEEPRFDPAVLAELTALGHTLVPEGEYGPRPRIQLAGVDRDTGLRVAVSDSRSDRGSLAQRTVP